MTPTIARILVPLDFSGPSDLALRYAVTLARHFGASLELFHVVEDVFAPGTWSAESYVPDVAALQQNMIADTQRQLAAVRSTIAREGVPVVTSYRTGRAAQAIVEYARTGEFDVIVMGTHGRTGFTHLLMGSVAERVVRTAPCAVLTVRSPIEKVELQPATVAEAVA